MDTSSILTPDPLVEAHRLEQPVDYVNNPPHYTKHPSGVECIDITRHMSFNLGNAMKYIWRCDLKADAIEDLKKAIFYIEDEIKKREGKVRQEEVAIKPGQVRYVDKIQPW